MIRCFLPHPCLAKSIDCYWIGDPGEYALTMLPDGGANIVLSFGDQITYTNHRGEKIIVDDIVLIGPHTKYYTLNSKNTSYIIGIKFKQGGVYHLINKPLHQYLNEIIPLKQVINQNFSMLSEGLKSFNKPEEIKKSLNKFLFIAITTKSKSSDKIDFALKALEINQTDNSIQEISEQLNITNKHLITLFKEKVGLTPKQVQRLNKFNAVLKLINTGKKLSWPSIAYACNYYDQAHLINEFKSFTGCSPSKYLLTHQKSTCQNILST